jgi:hypothetical protein
MHTKLCSEYLKETDLLGDLGIDGKILLKQILKKQDVRVWIGFMWLRRVHIDGPCVYGNELSDSIK